MEKNNNTNGSKNMGNLKENPAALISTIILAVIAEISFFACLGSNDFDTVSTFLTIFVLSILGALICAGTLDISYPTVPDTEDEPEEEETTENE